MINNLKPVSLNAHQCLSQPCNYSFVQCYLACITGLQALRACNLEGFSTGQQGALMIMSRFRFRFGVKPKRGQAGAG